VKLITTAAALVILTAPATAKDCRVPKDVGMRTKPPAGCGLPPKDERSVDFDGRFLKGKEGFIDLGNGTQLRVTGRVRAESIYRD
jgi:hypothetical protein